MSSEIHNYYWIHFEYIYMNWMRMRIELTWWVLQWMWVAVSVCKGTRAYFNWMNDAMCDLIDSSGWMVTLIYVDSMANNQNSCINMVEELVS